MGNRCMWTTLQGWTSPFRLPTPHPRDVVSADVESTNIDKSGVFLDVLMSSEMATFLSFLSTKEKQEILSIEYVSGIKRSCRIVLLCIVYLFIAHKISR